eukprot:6193361-Pleurochrysis_carterae.AAC.1
MSAHAYSTSCVHAYACTRACARVCVCQCASAQCCFCACVVNFRAIPRGSDPRLRVRLESARALDLHAPQCCRRSY